MDVFGHEEALFESIKGVKEAISGYGGGKTNNPTYESLETGTTGHAKTVNVFYDSSVINYPALLKIYFSRQDPTQVNSQGRDGGIQYRSVVFTEIIAKSSWRRITLKTFRRPVNMPLDCCSVNAF